MYDKKTSKFNYLIKDPLMKSDFFRLFFFRLSQMMHNKTNGNYNLFIQEVTKIFRGKLFLPNSNKVSTKELYEIVNELKKDGYIILPFSLSKEEIDKLIDFALNTPMYDKEGNKFKFDINKINYKKARYTWKMQDLIENITIQSILQDSVYAYIAQEYIEVEPILTSISLWLDPPSEEKQYGPHIYHQDNDGVKYLKFFFYLTDVDDESCPHVFIKGTHSEKKPIQFSSTKRFTNEELVNYYGKDNEIIFTASAGTIIAEDTKGFHRGTTPKTKYRLLMQLEFAMYDIPVYSEICQDKNIKKVQVDFDKNLKKIYRKFYI